MKIIFDNDATVTETKKYFMTWGEKRNADRLKRTSQ